jgi:hypothetical protein
MFSAQKTREANMKPPWAQRKSVEKHEDAGLVLSRTCSVLSRLTGQNNSQKRCRLRGHRRGGDFKDVFLPADQEVLKGLCGHILTLRRRTKEEKALFAAILRLTRSDKGVSMKNPSFHGNKKRGIRNRIMSLSGRL